MGVYLAMSFQKSLFIYCILYLPFICFTNINAKEVDVVKTLDALDADIVYSKVFDFSLINIHGKKEELSSYKGNWIFLAFWATWCSPCQYELPMLQGLYDELKDAGLKVIGVSIDQQGLSVVRNFVSKNSITFPILLDEQSTVASTYQAHSVPVIYLISPDYKIVGIVRGAKNWQETSVLEKVKELLKIKKIDNEVLAGYSSKKTEKEKIELQSNLTPPLLKVNLPQNDFIVNEEFIFEVLVSWQGDAYQYRIKTPKIIVPEGVFVFDPSSESLMTANGPILKYVYKLKIAKDGDYKIGPVEMVYGATKDKEGKISELHSRINGIDVTVRKNRTYIFVTIFILALLIIASLILFYKKKQKRKLLAIEQEKKLENKKIELENSWQRLQEIKINSSYRNYTVMLLELCIKYEMQREHNKISELINEIRYAGKVLSKEEVSFYERQFEKLKDMHIAH